MILFNLYVLIVMHIYMCLYDHDLFITKNVAISFVDELLMLFKE